METTFQKQILSYNDRINIFVHINIQLHTGCPLKPNIVFSHFRGDKELKPEQEFLEH